MFFKNIIQRKEIFISLIIAGFISLFLYSCKREDPIVLPEPEEKFNGWDTSFSIGSLIFPDADMLSRSVLNAGDTCRMKNFFNKLRYTGEIKVGFIGGSITQGAVTSVYDNCYASRLCYFLSKLFAGVDFVPINAGIGATDSRFGSSRAGDDLIIHQPDLIIVEFSVNDQIKDSLQVKASMEGLIRQCLGSGAEVMMLCMKAETQNDDMQNLHSAIGKYYNIPVISYHNAIEPLVQSGIIQWSDISPDYIHPNDLGHLITASLLFEHLRSSYILLGSDYNTPQPVPGSLFTDMFEYASIMKAADVAGTVAGNQGWSILPKEYDRVNLTTVHYGDSIELHTSWREITLMYWYDVQLNGLMEVVLDGQAVDTISNNFAGGWGGCYNTARLFIDNNSVAHTIVLRNLSNDLFDIRYILYAP